MSTTLLVLLCLYYLLRALFPTRTKSVVDVELAIRRWLKVRVKVDHERHD